jgi:hypothetical protein
MKPLYLVLFACLVIAGSCNKSSNEKKINGDDVFASKLSTAKADGILIPLNNCYNTTIGYDSIRVCFDSVLVDCRCPRKVQCVWAGYAEVELSITVNGSSQTVDLSTLGPDTVIISGYEFRFVDLHPYPVYGVTPAPGDIKVEITITKI